MNTLALVLLTFVVLLLVAVGSLWIFGERGHLLLPSTKRIMRQWRGHDHDRRAQPAGAPSSKPLGILKQLEGYVYGRWTNQYISVLIHRWIPRLSAEGRKELAQHYHGKVITHDEAKAIIQLDQPIRRDLEQIIPYGMARDLILSAPVDVAAYECACRFAREQHCEPTQVCMVVGSGPVSFILEHNPQSSRRLTQQEALDMLREEHERGHLHSAWFKDAMQGRFFAICNCCKCCCGGIRNMKEYGVPAVASSGYVASIDTDLCNACGICADACPFDSLKLNGTATLDWNKCMGCGVCVDQCVTGAIALVREERKGIPLDVRELVSSRAA
jgi:NAD-dependent dihydropyrimidine dehydrogenase PreA subunit